MAAAGRIARKDLFHRDRGCIRRIHHSDVCLGRRPSDRTRNAGRHQHQGHWPNSRRCCKREHAAPRHKRRNRGISKRAIRCWWKPTRVHHPIKRRRHCAVTGERESSLLARSKRLLVPSRQCVGPKIQNLAGKVRISCNDSRRIPEGSVGTAAREAGLELWIEHSAIALSWLTNAVPQTLQISDPLTSRRLGNGINNSSLSGTRQQDRCHAGPKNFVIRSSRSYSRLAGNLCPRTRLLIRHRIDAPPASTSARDHPINKPAKEP